jgi:uncharacterized membrane protein
MRASPTETFHLPTPGRTPVVFGCAGAALACIFAIAVPTRVSSADANFVLDPVWPWSDLWAVLLQLPIAIRWTGLFIALAVVCVPIFLFRPLSSRLMSIVGGLLLGVPLLLVIRHLIASGTGSILWTLWTLPWLLLLLLGPSLLAGFSVGLYAGSPGLSRRKLLLVAGLRLLAFVLALLAILRPSFAKTERESARSQLFVAVDRSRSMSVQDETGQKSRWELLLKSLKESEPILARLEEEQQIDVRFFAFAEELSEFDSNTPGEPDGKRTEIGAMLRALYDRRDPKTPLRGVLVVSDGADTGGIPALAEASRWRGIAAVTTFASGNPATTPKQKDVAITSISTTPQPFVPLKGKLNVKVTIDARGYENTKARVHLFLEDSDGKKSEVPAKEREVLTKDVQLLLTTGNEVTLTTDAPATPGEIKVRVVVDPYEQDSLPLNNTIETFVTVSKEGISVLLVDKPRSGEPQAICDALSEDARIRVTPIWVRDRAGAIKGFNLDEQPFDVIILGDVTIKQLQTIDPKAVEKIERQVARGAGLLVLGGYSNLGNGDWRGTLFEKLLPVDLTTTGQEEVPTQMKPTDDGIRRARYILRLDDTDNPKSAWNTLAKLDGSTKLRLKEQRTGVETILATTQNEEPLLVMQTYGAEARKGGASRVLVFGGDTTHRWMRDEASLRMHHRFWKQLTVWLAQQEDAQGNVWIRPDVRRVPIRTELGFQVGVRPKGGGADLRDGKFQVEITSPEGTKSPVPVMRGTTENRGTVTTLRTAGIYLLSVQGEAKDPSGDVVSGGASARVIVYDEDLELARPAADPEFLRKIAAAGEGESLRVEELAAFLGRLAERPAERGRVKVELSPDWRTTQRSGFLVFFFVIFCTVVSVEWGLRRAWGMV